MKDTSEETTSGNRESSRKPESTRDSVSILFLGDILGRKEWRTGPSSDTLKGVLASVGGSSSETSRRESSEMDPGASVRLLRSPSLLPMKSQLGDLIWSMTGPMMSLLRSVIKLES